MKKLTTKVKSKLKTKALNKALVIKSVCIHQWMHPTAEDGGKSECVKCGIKA